MKRRDFLGSLAATAAAPARRKPNIVFFIVDELGYLSFSRAGAELLFQVFADRYERGSILITSNLPFSKWDSIFKDPMTTAAAIDRVVHHSIIAEFGKEMNSHRATEAAQRQQETL